jgi:shikimate dehydrogenase
MIDGHTKLSGLIGWPVEHSLSPIMQNAAFSALHLNWRYLPLPVEPSKIAEAISGLAALGFYGANVTVPHKQSVIPFLDQLSPEARKIGAVNTITVEQGRYLIGHNTDSIGFIDCLRGNGFDPKKKQATVIGAGGAARAAVYALIASDASRITVLSRNPARADELARSFANSELHTRVLSKQKIVSCTRGSDLLVNATPVGMLPDVSGSIWPDDVPIPAHVTVFDLVYNPRNTRLLQQALDAGAKPISGLDMLIFQGAASFSLWTGKKPPIQAMRRALEEEIN